MKQQWLKKKAGITSSVTVARVTIDPVLNAIEQEIAGTQDRLLKLKSARAALVGPSNGM